MLDLSRLETRFASEDETKGVFKTLKWDNTSIPESSITPAMRFLFAEKLSGIRGGDNELVFGTLFVLENRVFFCCLLAGSRLSVSIEPPDRRDLTAFRDAMVHLVRSGSVLAVSIEKD